MKFVNLIVIGALALALQACSLESAEPAKAAPESPSVAPAKPPAVTSETTEEAPVNPATTKPATFELQISGMS